MWADEQVVRYISGTPSCKPVSWGRLLRYIGHWQAMGFGFWIVEDRETGAFLGEVGFADWKRDMEPSLNGVPEIGWVLARRAHGKGLATEAVAAALRWGDKNLPSASTVCIFDPEHAASIRVAQKNGYAKTGLADFAGKPTLVMARPSRS